MGTALVQYQNFRYHHEKSGLKTGDALKVLLHLIVFMMTHKIAATYFNECSCTCSLCNLARSHLTVLTSPLNRNHHIFIFIF